MPGNAGGEAWIVMPAREFRIASASRYKTDKGGGTYLLAGDKITFTRGPLKGVIMQRTGRTSVRELGENNQPTRLRCTMTSTDR